MSERLPESLSETSGISNEIMNIFSLPEDSIGISEDLNISSDGEQNAKMLALSLMILGNRNEAELGELISNISFDMQDDGIINSVSSNNSIYSSIYDLDKVAIRSNLLSRYTDLGIQVNIPQFEDYLRDTIFINASIINETSNLLGSIDVSVTGGFPPPIPIIGQMDQHLRIFLQLNREDI